jgi:gas vesicle protein
MGERVAVTGLMAVLTLFLTGCPKSGQEPGDTDETTAGQFKQKADQALQASADYLAQQRVKLLETSREQLDRLEEQLNTWIDEVDTEDDQVRQKLDQLRERFETALGQARLTIDKAAELGLEAWRDAKPDLEAALGEAREAYDEFMTFVKAQAKPPEQIVEE